MLVKIKGRGFNTPGGHVEIGESPEIAFIQEALEEGYVNGPVSLLGYIEVNHEENPLFYPRGKYPLIGYQVYYQMDISEVFPFKGEFESKAHIWVEPDFVSEVIDNHTLHKLILKQAMRNNSSF